MAAEDWLPAWYEGDDEEVECPHCSKRGLYFEYRSDRLILVDSEGRAHAPHCKGRMAKPSEFPALEGDDGR